MNKDLSIFFTYIFSDLCNCVKKECNIVGIEDTSPEFFNNFINKEYSVSNCNMIKNDGKINLSIDNIISIFLLYNLLNHDGRRYYILNSHKRFNWKNIKQIDNVQIQNYITKFPNNFKTICLFFNGTDSVSDDIFGTYIKYIFWYFRKAIVDNITGNIIKTTKVIGLSVGSTKIDSDYDITLYGSYTKIFETINIFNKRIEKIFNYNSEKIFDTNVYGASFITSNFTHPSLNKFSCGDTKFSLSYKSPNPSFFITQHIWAFIKVLIKLESLQDEIVYDFLHETLFDSSPNLKAILSASEEFINKFDSNPLVYDKIVSLLDKPIDNDSWETNYISFVNYNGSETYFTRGAFIDVVVNSQMCSSEYIQLSPDEFFDSFIENIAELLTHFTKDKYINRAKISLPKLNLDNHDKPLDLLNNNIDIQNKCKSKESVLSCSKFLVLYNCIVIIKSVSESFLENINNNVLDNGIALFKELSSQFPSYETLKKIPNYKLVSDEKLSQNFSRLRNKSNSNLSLDKTFSETEISV